jgi:UDP-N-acetylglucosamine acyltransferase
VSRGTIDKMKTVIGNNCLIMSYAHIAHDCIVGNNCIVVNAVQMAGHVEMGDYAIIGGSSAVHQFVKIGAHAMVSGGSLVRKDVPPFVKAAREPLTYAGINSIGLRRRGFNSEQINEVQQIYRILFMNGFNYTEALDKIELELAPSRERDEILNFVRNSGRGIIKSYLSKDAN